MAKHQALLLVSKRSVIEVKQDEGTGTDDETGTISESKEAGQSSDLCSASDTSSPEWSCDGNCCADNLQPFQPIDLASNT